MPWYKISLKLKTFVYEPTPDKAAKRLEKLGKRLAGVDGYLEIEEPAVTLIEDDEMDI